MRIVDHDQRRAEFVAASWDVIAAEGLNGATLKRIAARARCTTGALTHYFDDRDALLTDALRTAHFAAGARILQAAARATTDPERLRSVLLEALPLDERRLREWKVWVSFWGATIGNETLTAENTRRYEEWSELLANLLAPFTLSDVDNASEVSRLMALVDGLGLRLALYVGAPAGLTALREDCLLQIDHSLARLWERSS